MRDDKQSEHKGRDYLVYVCIGLAVVAVIAYLAIRDAHENVHREFKNDWTVALISAAIGFGNATRSLWRFENLWRFWAMLMGCIAIHFAVLIPLFSKVQKVPLVWGVPIAVADALLATLALRWAAALSFRKAN